MNRSFFNLLVALGLGVLAWVGFGFIGHSLLALLMTALIAAVFGLGVLELHRFRQSSAQLSAALNQAPADAAGLDSWLALLPAAMRTPVRLRLEGERSTLPGPALTPYLVGLLVMLGMLGTFLGMVITFKGAVFALEGSTDLQTIRSALAAPLKGLGLSFGTSVAGVAASAVLGLLSSISRRERMAVVRQLDSLVATTLHPYTLAHQRQQAYQAVQTQAAGLPAVVERLGALLTGLEQRNQQLNDQLLAQQTQFHQQTTATYTQLASQVETALQRSLTDSARAAVDNLQPLLANGLQTLTQDSRQLQQQQLDSTQAQLTRMLDAVQTAVQQHQQWFAHQEHQRLDQLTAALTQQSDTLRTEWQRMGTDSLAQQKAICQTLETTAQSLGQQHAQQLNQAASEWKQLLQGAEQLVQTRMASEADWLQQQQARMDQLADLWHQELAALRTEEAQRGQAAVERLGELQAAMAQQLGSLGQAMETPLQRLLQTASTVGRDSVEQQRAICQTLEATAQRLSEQQAQQQRETASEWARLLQGAEQLVQTRMASETDWLQQQQARMDQLADLWRQELAALRSEEALRGQAAVERLGELQTAVAQQLGTLGQALEAPISRMLQTAAEVPQAAAEVMTQLRQQATLMTQRDTQALQERTQVMKELDALLQTLQQASASQERTFSTLVQSANATLEQAGHTFSEALQAQAQHATEQTVHLHGSAIELSSLGAAFDHGVQRFTSSNEQLLTGLQRIESALQQSQARSDEQLAYYVAQAREVVDLSISAQQGILEDLRRLQAEQRALAAGAA